MSTAQPEPFAVLAGRFNYDAVIHQQTIADLDQVVELLCRYIADVSSRHRAGMGIDAPGDDPVSMQAVVATENALKAHLDDVRNLAKHFRELASRLRTQRDNYEQNEGALTETLSRLAE